MNKNHRFLLIVLGTANGIDKDLNFIADGETGVNFVDGKGMFICTFFSPYTATEIHERMAHRPAIMIFDITNNDTYGVNLPSKYYMGIFPEIQEAIDSINSEVNWEPIAGSEKGKVINETEEVSTKISTKKEVVEEYDTVNDILEKLSRNKYDRGCLTEKEISILNQG